MLIVCKLLYLAELAIVVYFAYLLYMGLMSIDIAYYLGILFIAIIATRQIEMFYEIPHSLPVDSIEK